MKTPREWFTAKLTEPCTCASGQIYRDCCLPRECVYFIVGILAALWLFGAHVLPGLLIAVPLLVLAAFSAKVCFDRRRRKVQNHEDAG
jgi:hypothetical protein